MIEPQISVGIMSAHEIKFSLFSPYKLDGDILKEGDYSAHISNGKINFNGKLYDQVLFQANDIHSDSFEIGRAHV